MGVDQQRNQLRIVVASASSAQAVGATIGMSLPSRAWRVDVDRILNATTLQQLYRPLRAGLQSGRRIYNPQFGIYGNQLCTIGPMVKVNGVPGFLTNSHCTSGPPWSPAFAVAPWADSLRFHQPAYNNLVGTETVDPATVVCDVSLGLPPCAKCRFTETAFVQLAGGVPWHLGRIVATTGAAGSLTVDPDTSHHWITRTVDWGMIQGQPFRKIGRTTGRQDGTVGLVCQNVRSELDSTVWHPCQVFAYVTSGPGDSGSPVFQTNVWQGDQYGVKLLGIWWAHFESSCTLVGGIPTTCTEGIFSPAYQLGGPDYDYPNIVVW